ncbi:retrovirus-related pol polyprotein from transposon TNT 1-94 [Tanacetum coccineum]|uniref:Retrovirus-related pol polyprotein from transposon TNT 1-94 n=1 Tax=Tanacetum coccineum TaxID=301880 RepID=A0ABQ5CZG0_9ASTR
MQDKKLDLSFFYVFGALCYPTNDNDDLGNLDAEADIGNFIGYAPAKKAFRIYIKRTQKIIETIHVTFDELTTMASEQFSSGLGLHSMTPATSSSGLVPNNVSQQPCIPPNIDDWDHLFQPCSINTSLFHLLLFLQFKKLLLPRAVILADTPVSTSIDQDAPSISIPSTQEQEYSPNISQGFEESPKTPTFRDDPLNESLHEVLNSQGSSSNVKIDEFSGVLKNKARLVAQGFMQEERIDFEESFAPLVNISKRRAFWSLNEDILKIRDSDNQYAVSVKEDTAVDDDLHNLRSVEAEFPAIVIDDAFAPQDALPCKSQVSTPINDEIDFRISFNESDDENYTIICDKNSFSYKMISVNNLKTDSENDNEKVMPSIPSPEPAISCFDDLDFFKDFENEFPAIVYNDAQTSKSDLLTKPILSPQHTDELNLNNETSVSEYDEEEQKILYFNDLFPSTLFERLERIYNQEIHRVQVVDFQGMPELMRDGPLVWELIMEFLSTLRFGEVLFDLDTPGTIQFQLARLAKHFGLLTAEILGGLTVIAPELLIIDMAELVRLQICIEVGDTWAWVAMGPERQPDAAAGALGVAQDATAVDDGGHADPAPAQAPPPPAAAARTMPQRLARLEEDVHEIRGTLA